MESLRKTTQRADNIEAPVVNETLAQRVVALAPTAQDASLCSQVLEQNGFAVCCCDSMDAFLQAIKEGAGIALVAEEHLDLSLIHI